MIQPIFNVFFNSVMLNILVSPILNKIIINLYIIRTSGGYGEDIQEKTDATTTTSEAATSECASYTQNTERRRT